MAIIITTDWWAAVWTPHLLAHQPSQLSWHLTARGSGETTASRAGNDALFSDRAPCLSTCLSKKSLLLGHQAGPEHGSGTGCCGTDVNANTLVFDPG